MSTATYTMFLGIGEALPGSSRVVVTTGYVTMMCGDGNGVYLGC